MTQQFVDTREFLSQTKFYEGYSRFKDDNSRYETWDEAVDRVINMHDENYINYNNELKKTIPKVKFNVIPNIKIAICFSGLTRSLSRLVNQYLEMLIKPYNADVFLHTWDIDTDLNAIKLLNCNFLVSIETLDVRTDVSASL